MQARLQNAKATDVFSNAHEQYEKVLERLSSADFQCLNHGDIEGYVEQEGTELLRRLLQGHLDLRALEEGSVEEVLGAERTERTHRGPIFRRREKTSCD